ncbi:MAG: tyrosine-type recombinase/integrase [Geminicoccaceae bacterium]
MAAELLLTTSLRVGNLIDLRLGEAIRRLGEGRQARWAIEIPAERVKNKEPLRFALLPESTRLLEWYLTHWHGYWAGPASPWLFPDRGGGHVAGYYLSRCLAGRARRHVGVPITCHQFRHLMAELYLAEDPTGLGVVTAYLGHRRLDTARQFYCREQSRVATKAYHEVLVRRRGGSRRPPARPAAPPGWWMPGDAGPATASGSPVPAGRGLGRTASAGAWRSSRRGSSSPIGRPAAGVRPAGPWWRGRTASGSAS